jgi:Uma2 family endonuclease
MTQAIQLSTREAMSGRFHDLAEFLHDLGDIPPERVVMDPWPGTATEADLLVFVERDKRFVELIDGTLVEKPMGSHEALIAGVIVQELNNFVRPRKLGYVLTESALLRMVIGRIRMPDASFISVDDLPDGKLPKTPVWRLPPRLAVEVLSETNTVAEMQRKMAEYFDSGAKLVWIVDPDTQTVAVYTSVSERPDRVIGVDGILDGGSVLPGFELKVADLFSGFERQQ